MQQPSRTPQLLLTAIIALVLLAGAFSGGLLVGWAMSSGPNNPANVLTTGQTATGTAPQDKEELFRPFWQAWDLVHQNYVDPVNDEKMMRGAISGMVSSLGDPHTSYMDPVQFQDTTAHLEGQEYDGIGAWVDITGEYLKIISPMPGSPAEKAGIRGGDTIIAVDKVDMTGQDGEAVLNKVKGPAGSTVVLTIRRGDAEPIDITVARAKILVPQVETKMIENDIAYVRLFTFGSQTTEEMRKGMKELLAKNPKGLILDLRNNGGGYLETSVQVLSEFFPKDTIVMHEVFGDGTRKTYKARGNGMATDIPLVVLINEGSASASEITAGAIQDLGRGKLIGVKSYGKGSVQISQELMNDQGAVRVTIARWLTPKDRQINKLGLNPDIEVKITDDDIKAGLDTQLKKAIELLKSGSK